MLARRQRELEALAEEILTSENQVATFAADLTERAAVEATVDRASQELGPIDVVIHAAGINIRERALDRLTAEAWENMLRTNLTAAFHLTQVVVQR